MRIRIATLLVAFAFSLVAAPLAAFASPGFVLGPCNGPTYPDGTHVPAGQASADAICIATLTSVGSAQDAASGDAQGWFPGSTSVEKVEDGMNAGRMTYAFIIKYPASQRVRNPAGLAEVNGAFFGPGAEFDADALVWRPLSDEAILASGKHLEAGVPKPDVSPPAQQPAAQPQTQPAAQTDEGGFVYPRNADEVAARLGLAPGSVISVSGNCFSYGGAPVAVTVPQGMVIDNQGKRFHPGQNVPTSGGFTIWIIDP